QDRQLCADRQEDRQAQRGTRRGAGLRRQQSGDRHSLPPGGEDGWRPVGLSLGRGAETGIAGARGSSMRLAAQDWDGAAANLDAQGWALLPRLLDPSACARMQDVYEKDIFRSQVVMARHGFGRGKYKYLAYRLPEPIATLRPALYARLAPIANRWTERRDEESRYPARHEDFLNRCHQAGQARP